MRLANGLAGGWYMNPQNEHEDPFVNRVREILLGKWDPVCIGSNPNLRDDYDKYVNHLAGILRDPSTTKSLVVEYLLSVEVREMCLPGDRGRLSLVADALLKLRGNATRDRLEDVLRKAYVIVVWSLIVYVCLVLILVGKPSEHSVLRTVAFCLSVVGAVLFLSYRVVRTR